MIVGAGDYMENLKAQVSSLELDNSVEFTGFVSKERKLEILRKSHVAVLPSLKEGWGLTNIEANAVGTTVVAADSPGLRDSVSDNVSGLLYKYGDIEEMTDKLMMILQDDSLRKNLEAGALKWSAKFDWDISAKQFEKLLYDISGATN